MLRGSFIRDFSDSESDGEEVHKFLLKRRRGCNRTWIKVAEFQTTSEAENAVNVQSVRKSVAPMSVVVGRMLNTGVGQYGTNEYPVRLYYLLYHSGSGTVSLFETDCEHANHASIPLRSPTPDTKNFVQEAFNEERKKLLNLQNQN